MSIVLDCFFEDHTTPLKKVELVDMIPERTYITLDGSRIKLTGDRDIELVNTSPLWDGEKVTALTPKGVELFFKLIGK
jgi:hypothetical protein